MAKCNHCGAEISSGDLFCGECGEKIEASTSEKETSETSTTESSDSSLHFENISIILPNVVALAGFMLTAWLLCIDWNIFAGVVAIASAAFGIVGNAPNKGDTKLKTVISIFFIIWLCVVAYCLFGGHLIISLIYLIPLFSHACGVKTTANSKIALAISFVILVFCVFVCFRNIHSLNREKEIALEEITMIEDYEMDESDEKLAAKIEDAIQDVTSTIKQALNKTSGKIRKIVD